MTEFLRHPEWKRLYDAILPLIEAGETTFPYEVIQELMGLDARTMRGRGQFLRFAREILAERDIHFACEAGRGYRIVDANEHSKYGLREVVRARRRIKRGREIAIHTRLEQLTPGEQRILTDFHVRIAMLEASMKKETREIRKLIALPERLPAPLLDNKPKPN